MKERPDYLIIDNNCQNFAMYLSEAINPGLDFPKEIQTVKERYFTAVDATLPGAYPPSIAGTETESGTYYTVCGSIPESLTHETPVDSECRHLSGSDVEISLWEDFLTNGEIEHMISPTSVVGEALRRRAPIDWTFIRAVKLDAVGVLSFLALWGHQVRFLNAAMYQCACLVQATEDPRHIAIRHRPRWGGANLDAYQYASTKERCELDSREPHPQRKRLNRMPGELRTFAAVNYAKLTRFGDDERKPPFLHTIHDLIDQSNARYGYLVNPKELVFFRRTAWHHLEISPAIRHDVEVDVENGIWNSKIVLFYFHWIVANDESSWRWNVSFTEDCHCRREDTDATEEKVLYTSEEDTI
jgi:hypothetical protein